MFIVIINRERKSKNKDDEEEERQVVLASRVFAKARGEILSFRVCDEGW